MMNGVPGSVFQEPTAEMISQYYASMRPFWYPVLASEALAADRPVGVELLGEGVALARLDGEVVAYQDLCRHFQARLSLGEIDHVNGAACLRCVYHGWAYDRQGVCVEIPQLAKDRSIPKEARVPTYLVQVKYDLIWICLAETPMFDIPAFDEFEDPEFHLGPLRRHEPWEASAPRIIMGTLDDTHFPWVHPGLLGDRKHPEAPDHEVWREGQYLVSKYTILQPRNVTTADVSGDLAARDNRYERVTYTDYVGIPNVIRLIKDGASGRFVIWSAVTPHQYNATTTFWRLARNYDLDPARDDEYEAFSDRARAQDKPVVESQRPWLLPPFWTKIELPLRPADLPLIEYQKWLEELQITISI